MTIYVAGHSGMVGSAVLRRLHAQGIPTITRSHADLDLTDQSAVRSFLMDARPDAVIIAAAKVGGIHANTAYPAQFIYENLMIQANLIHQSFKAGVTRLLFLGSSCIYPRGADQPMTEAALLTGPLEPTNEPYAIAKIAGIKLCESYNRQYGTDYRSVMPTNLYGPGDNFHPDNSHVLPALMRRFHDAVVNGQNQVVIWGTGQPLREFLHVDDMADGALFVHNLGRAAYAANTKAMRGHINLGSGSEISIADLAGVVAAAVGFQGQIVFDTAKPDGSPRKLLDVSRLSNLGWNAKIPLNAGILETYDWYKSNVNNVRQG